MKKSKILTGFKEVHVVNSFNKTNLSIKLNPRCPDFDGLKSKIKASGFKYLPERGEWRYVGGDVRKAQTLLNQISVTEHAHIRGKEAPDTVALREADDVNRFFHHDREYYAYASSPAQAAKIMGEVFGGVKPSDMQEICKGLYHYYIERK